MFIGRGDSMMRPLAILHAVFFSFSMVLLAGSAQAQFRASLRGTVTDQSGAVVPGATVTLTNKDTNAKLTYTSDDNGIYQFNALPPAPYRLTVEHAGFQQKVLDNVQIIPEQLNSLDLQMAIGEATQTITVTDTTQ